MIKAISNNLFKYRFECLLVFVVLTVFFSSYVLQLKIETKFENMLPQYHPYIENYVAHKEDLPLSGNAVKIAVSTQSGDIFNADYLSVLKSMHDEVFYFEGVDRSGLQSLWSPNMRWVEVTEEGFSGGQLIPYDYDASDSSLQQLQENVQRSSYVGRLIANDYSSSIIYVPINSYDQQGLALNYHHLSRQLESLREYYQSDSISIQITGFVKVVGDLMDGASQVVYYFVFAFFMIFILLLLCTRCLKATMMPLLCAVIAVIWQLGLLGLLGVSLDAYVMLIPFLIFSIAVSHGVQVINDVSINILKGDGALQASERTFKHLVKPCCIALATDALGFMTLSVIDIPVMKNLALVAALGVIVVVFINLILLPILLSYIGVSYTRIKKIGEIVDNEKSTWLIFSFLLCKKGRALVLFFMMVAFIFGFYQSQYLQIGDLHEGVSELRVDSRYNKDNAHIVDKFNSSSDVFVVMVKSGVEQCVDYSILRHTDDLVWQLKQKTYVDSIVTLPSLIKDITVANNEANLKWYGLSSDQYVINNAMRYIPQGFISGDCSLTPLVIYLDNHKAETLKDLTQSINTFSNNMVTSTGNDNKVEFLLAAGNAGIQAAVNQTIERAQLKIMVLIYGVVIFICWFFYREWIAVVSIVTPLLLTSVLCQALMVGLDVGVKVSTLPVIALGVGVGVDYGIYIFNRLRHYLSRGLPMADAYLAVLTTSGRAVCMTGFILSAGVVTWVFSPIQYQADMGLLLSFMFLFNMLGAMFVLPVLYATLKSVVAKVNGIDNQGY